MIEEIKKGHHRTVKILATLFEQKVCDFNQLHRLSMMNVSESVARDTIAKLQSVSMIESTVFHRVGKRPSSIYSLTPLGYNKLLWHCDYLPDFKQIKSNYKEHDLALSDLRIVLQQFIECQYFISENILKSKLFEDSSSTLSIVRTANADAAILINLSGKKTWCALEYEKSKKSNFRYTEKFKRWYSNTELKAIFLVCESQQLQSTLAKIEKEIFPHIERKILFANYDDITTLKSKTANFSTSSGLSVQLHQDKSRLLPIPSLQPSLDI